MQVHFSHISHSCIQYIFQYLSIMVSLGPGLFTIKQSTVENKAFLCKQFEIKYLPKLPINVKCSAELGRLGIISFLVHSPAYKRCNSCCVGVIVLLLLG